MNEMDMDYRDDYRGGNYRSNYRYDYRDDYRDYDRRGGRRNYRNYRDYRDEDYYTELEECMEDMRENYRELEDVAEMATDPQHKNTLMKIAEREKEHHKLIKEMLEK